MEILRRSDGLCAPPTIAMRAHQLVGTVCIRGGADCPLLEREQAERILARIGADPTATIRLESPADAIPHYTALADRGYSTGPREDVFNRKRDLDVLQRLGLVPGDVRRARYLYTLLFERLETPAGLCSYETRGWEGCPLATRGAYERIRAQGWQALVFHRTDEERHEYRRHNVHAIETGDRLLVRPHHLMCLSCWYGATGGGEPRPNDSLYEIFQRVRRDPKVAITLVEGCCEACDCCDGFHPPTGRCVHACGLVRDYKKDLDCFQKLGLFPGDTLPADEVFTLLYERIHSTREVCGYGDGIVRSEEWQICGDPGGHPGYVKARRKGVFA